LLHGGGILFIGFRTNYYIPAISLQETGQAPLHLHFHCHPLYPTLYSFAAASSSSSYLCVGIFWLTRFKKAISWLICRHFGMIVFSLLLYFLFFLKLN